MQERPPRGYRSRRVFSIMQPQASRPPASPPQRRTEGRLGDRPLFHPPPQQPERHDEDGQQEIAARYLQHRADPRADNADHRDQPLPQCQRSCGARSGASGSGQGRDTLPDTIMQIRESSVQTAQHSRLFASSPSLKFPLHMAELILCKACQQGVFVLLADGQPRTVQHLETVASNRSTLSIFSRTPRLQTRKFSWAESSCSTWEKVAAARHSPSSVTTRTMWFWEAA